MRNLLVAASVAALAIPCAAMAQPNCWGQHEGDTAAGTVSGAGAGALAGAAVGGPIGAAVGAVGGAAVGSAAGASAPTSCDYVEAGYYDGAGVWHPNPNYAYQGPAYQGGGYYDADGRWVPGAAPPPPMAGDYGADVSYAGSGGLMGREARLDQMIDNGQSNGRISDWQARRDHYQLDRIRRFQDDRMAEAAGLSPVDRADVARRLDDLDATVHAQWAGD